MPVDGLFALLVNFRREQNKRLTGTEFVVLNKLRVKIFGVIVVSP